MINETKQYIIRCVEIDLGHAQDDHTRALMQQNRMPFDHDNNNYVLRCELRVARGKLAIEELKKL